MFGGINLLIWKLRCKWS